MISYLKARYSDRNEALRALAHGMLSGLAVIFLGHLGFLVAPIIELYQWKTDPDYSIKDGLCDLSEHWLGGLLIGRAFLIWSRI